MIVCDVCKKQAIHYTIGIDNGRVVGMPAETAKIDLCNECEKFANPANLKQSLIKYISDKCINVNYDTKSPNVIIGKNKIKE